jgi:hypothetical protein
MRDNGFIRSVAALRRKVRGLAAVVADPAATVPEKENAAALKKRLEQRLRETGAPAGDWTDKAFRLGRWAKEIRRPASPAQGEREKGEGEWTDQARRLGKVARRAYKKWSSE